MNSTLTIIVTHSDGTTTRFGPEEGPARIPQRINFSSINPGGWKDASWYVPRRIDVETPDLNLLDEVEILAPGNVKVFEGRISQLPRDHGDSHGIQVGCTGWSAHMQDEPFREIYVDRDFSAWEGPSVQRQLNVNGVYSHQSHSLAPDETTGFPSLATILNGTWTATTRALVEAVYHRGPEIGSLYYAWKKGDPPTAAGGNWYWAAVLSPDDVNTAVQDTGNLQAAGPGTGTLTASGSAKFYAMVEFYNNAAGGADNASYPVYWTTLAVYGTHGLTKRGTASATEAQGFYASDIIRDVVTRACPKLTVATDSIEETAFVIPHAVFADITTADDVVARVNAYHLWDWGVWDDKTFHYRQPDPERLTWEARLSEGAHVALEGDQAADLFNGVIVHYTDPLGKQKTAGPVGSGADVENAALEDTSVTNPVNAQGYGLKVQHVNVTVTTTDAGAVQLGAIFLAEHSIPQRRGTITVTGSIRHPTKALRPGYEVRAGDYVRISDHPADLPRKIIEARWDDDSQTVSMSVGTPAFKLDAILERLSVQAIGRVG